MSLAHPGYVARIKQSPDKTDFGDARLLADLIRVGYLPKVCLKLMELAGVGLITALTLRSEVGRFDRFGTGKQLARSDAA